jgi:hypothetical protein
MVFCPNVLSCTGLHSPDLSRNCYSCKLELKMPQLSRMLEPSPVNCGAACMHAVRYVSAKFVHHLAYG